MESSSEGHRREGGREPANDSEEQAEAGTRKQIYLRTVYPLNPGIPHYVDVPGSW